jgi:hypothetical protein
VGPPVSHTIRTTASQCRPRLDRGRRLVRPQPPPHAAFKRSAPPREMSFSSSTRCHHCAVVPPSLSRTDARSSPYLLVGALGSSSTPPPPFLSSRIELPQTAHSSHPPTVLTPPQASRCRVHPPRPLGPRR